MFLTAAQVLNDQVSQNELDKGMIYPPLKNIREVSFNIAIAVAEHVYDGKTTRSERPKDLEKKIRDYMYDPDY